MFSKEEIFLFQNMVASYHLIMLASDANMEAPTNIPLHTVTVWQMAAEGTAW